MVDRPITPTPSTGYAAEVAYSPTPLPTPPAPVVQPARPVTPTPMTVVTKVESGNRDIPQAIHDVNTDRGTPAGGYFQIIDPTWRTYAARAGVDLNKYPRALGSPAAIQAKVASVIPVNQWGPNTVAALRQKFPWIDINQPLGVAEHAAIATGGSGWQPGPTTASTPSKSNLGTPSKSNLGEALRNGDIGGAMKALTEQDEKGKSMLGDAAKAVLPQPQGGGGGEAPQMPQAPPPMNPVAASAPGAAQLMSQVIAARGRPLTWSAAPFGSGIAGPQVPGTTLNSGGGYG